jgi:hypothetical protein
MRKAIDELMSELEKQVAQVAETKRAINSLCAVMGEQPRFPDDVPEEIGGTTHIRSDQFFGQTLTGAVREFLRIKGQSASVDEIYGALENGGFVFDWPAQKHHKKNLRMSLTKNSTTFAYIKSSDTFGLWEFYPEKAKERKKEKEEEPTEEPVEEEEIPTAEAEIENDEDEEEVRFRRTK